MIADALCKIHKKCVLFSSEEYSIYLPHIFHPFAVINRFSQLANTLDLYFYKRHAILFSIVMCWQPIIMDLRIVSVKTLHIYKVAFKDISGSMSCKISGKPGEMEQFMKKKDYIFLIAVLIFGGILWFILRPTDIGENALVRITVDGELYGEYALDENQEIAIGNTNVCVIEDGNVYMKSADCPDQICVKTKPIHTRSGSIICLPNKVNVEIVGNIGDNNEPDAVAR